MNASRPPVVVGISDKQPSAVRFALAEAGRRRTGLSVVHSYSFPAQGVEFYVGINDVVEATRVDGESLLEDARAIIVAEESSVDVEYLLVLGTAKGVLGDMSEQADALVLGSDDVPWLERLIGGEVAGHLARSAQCPVVVVPEREVPAIPATGVVVTIDGDTSAEGPLRYAFEQADARGEKLHVLHAAPVATLQEDFENHQANVAEIVAGWQVLYPDVEVERVVTTGDPADVGVDATGRAALVVMGRPHGFTVPFAAARPLAMRVLREAQCPVAVVPSGYRRR